MAVRNAAPAETTGAAGEMAVTDRRAEAADLNDPKNHEDPQPENVPNKAKVVTWFLLLVVTMTFGGLIGAYVVVFTNNVAEWQPFQLPIQVWMSTAIIIISSFTYHIAQRAVEANDHAKLRKYLVATTALGAAFISSQILAWMALVDRGLYMSGNPYAGFFYILTGIHAAHVLGGVIALGAIILRTATPTEHGPELEYRRNLARSVGWYWHFMGRDLDSAVYLAWLLEMN